jgi:polyhydroxyalkanoate synthesis regulator phasin
MPENDTLKRYLDAGMAFTQLTRARAEEMVKDLVKRGELRREQVQEQVDDLLDRSRQNTEALVGVVRKEIADQLGNLGLATKEDIKRLEAKIAGKPAGAAKAPAKKASSSKTGSSAKKAVKKA